MRRTLAAGDITLVEQCTCGSIHLTVGAVTLRLARGAVDSLAATLAEAAQVIAVQERHEVGSFEPVLS